MLAKEPIVSSKKSGKEYLSAWKNCCQIMFVYLWIKVRESGHLRFDEDASSPRSQGEDYYTLLAVDDVQGRTEY